jgi:hypothetical protein
MSICLIRGAQLAVNTGGPQGTHPNPSDMVLSVVMTHRLYAVACAVYVLKLLRFEAVIFCDI